MDTSNEAPSLENIQRSPESKRKENAATKLVNRLKSHSLSQAFGSTPSSSKGSPAGTPSSSFSSAAQKGANTSLKNLEAAQTSSQDDSNADSAADCDSVDTSSSKDVSRDHIPGDEGNVLSAMWHDLSKFTTKMVSKASHQLRSGLAHAEENDDESSAHEPHYHHHHHHHNESKKPPASGLSNYVSSFLPNAFFPSTFSPLASHTDIVLQGSRYNASSAPRFMNHWTSLPWITYREGIPPIRPSTYTSDVGWGCMIRAGQMMLATALLQARFGRDWKLSDLTDESDIAAYISVMFQFLDSTDSAFSIHRIALAGRLLAKNIGEWFGPSTIAQALCELVHEYPQSGVHLYIANDAIVYSKSIEQVLNGVSPVSGAPPDGQEPVPKPVLVLVPLRLGVESFNMTYLDGLKTCFESNECIGIAGGRPNSALFFVGYQDDQLLCLDPHITRTAVEQRPDFDYTLEDFSSYVSDTPRALPVSRVDPSLVIGFLIRDMTELSQFMSRWARMATLTKTPLFSVGDNPPSFYSTWDSIYGRPPPVASPSLSPTVSLSDSGTPPLSSSPPVQSVPGSVGPLPAAGGKDAAISKSLQLTKNKLKSLSNQASATLAKTRDSMRRPSRARASESEDTVKVKTELDAEKADFGPSDAAKSDIGSEPLSN